MWQTSQVSSSLASKCFSDERPGRQAMSKLGRRVVLRGSVGLAAAGTFASPYIARAQAKTASVLWVQGFVKEEDEAFQNLVAAYEKARGNKIEFSLIPFTPAMQSSVAGLTSGDTPANMFHEGADQRVRRKSYRDGETSERC